MRQPTHTQHSHTTRRRRRRPLALRLRGPSRQAACCGHYLAVNNNKLLLLLASYCCWLLLLSSLSPSPIITHVQAVDCFKCSSRNGSNPACEDPFHNLNPLRVTLPVLPDHQPGVIYHTPCYAGRKNREGLFPASACIKLKGIFEATGESLVVRHCALDSGSLTQDTELARMSHCGKFQFEGDLLQGCVLACPEDACNGASRQQQALFSSLLMPFITTSLLLVSYYRHHLV